MFGIFGDCADDSDRGFAKKGCMDTYLTKKTRVIVKEVEKGWWVLAVSERHSSSSHELVLMEL